MTHVATSPRFKENAKAALADPELQNALKFVEVNFIARRREVADRLPEFDALRDAARDIKDHTLAHLDLYLEAYERKVAAAGGQVHYAVTADEARGIILDICRRLGARTVTKGKSMVAEEIALNEHLEANGIAPVETDLGEYIIQLRHEMPSHIIAARPAPASTSSGCDDRGAAASYLRRTSKSSRRRRPDAASRRRPPEPPVLASEHPLHEEGRLR